MPKLSEIKKKLYQANKTKCNQIWNKNIKKILKNENQETEVISAGDPSSYQRNADNFFTKIKLLNTINNFIFKKFGPKKALLLSFSFSIILFYLSISYIPSILFTFIPSNYMATLILAFILFFCFGYMFFSSSTFFSKYNIESIFYILTPDSFNFYNINKKEITKIQINLEQIEKIIFDKNFKYYQIFIKEESKIYTILTDKNIPEIENLKMFEKPKESKIITTKIKI